METISSSSSSPPHPPERRRDLYLAEGTSYTDEIIIPPPSPNVNRQYDNARTNDNSKPSSPSSPHHQRQQGHSRSYLNFVVRERNGDEENGEMASADENEHDFFVRQQQQLNDRFSTMSPWSKAAKLTSTFVGNLFHGGRVVMKKGTTTFLWSQILLTAISALYFAACAYVNSLSQVIAQTIAEEKFSERLVLPDIGFYVFPKISWLRTEFAVGAPLAFMYCRLTFTLFHGLIRKWCMRADESTTIRMITIPFIVVKRVLIIHGSIFILRAFAIVVTILPNPHDQCVPTINRDASPFWNALLITSGQAYTCNDVFFSGHAAAITLSLMFWMTYSRERRFTYMFILPFSVVCLWTLIATRFHYTLDIFFGVLMAFLAWMVYHTGVRIHYNQATSPMSLETIRSKWSISIALILFNIIEGIPAPMLPSTNPAGQHRHQHHQQQQQEVEKITNGDDLFSFPAEL